MGKLERGRCGLCCTLLVRIDDRDIGRIKALGHKESSFVGKTSRKEMILKQVNGYCTFLKIEKGMASCTIYESRPRICREYECIGPNDKECKLRRHYSVIQLGKIEGV